jgi:hypothetical protein
VDLRWIVLIFGWVFSGFGHGGGPGVAGSRVPRVPELGRGGQDSVGNARRRARILASRSRLGGSRKVSLPAWRMSRPGMVMSRWRRVAIMALPPRMPCPVKDVLTSGGGGELVQPGGHAGGE